VSGAQPHLLRPLAGRRRSREVGQAKQLLAEALAHYLRRRDDSGTGRNRCSGAEGEG
jgi:hypothetical protein